MSSVDNESIPVYPLNVYVHAYSLTTNPESTSILAVKRPVHSVISSVTVITAVSEVHSDTVTSS